MNTSGLIPTHDKVILKLAQVATHTAGGIALPDLTVQKETQAQYIGELVDAGPTARASEELAGIAEGDLVIFAKFAGFVVQGKDAMYRIVRVTDVVGKAEGFFDKRLQGSIPMPDNS